MKRKEKVWEYLKTVLPNAPQGVTTSKVAMDLDLVRTNASKELNVLVKEGKLAKTATRPVKYFFADQAQPAIASTSKEKKAKDQAPKIANKDQKDHQDDIFDHLIGRTSSLKNQIEQAKAAILYPPHGLNVLITGPTGSGKTYFANAMNQFACNQGVISNPRLTTFNCADYAHNPQLLMSHLFGYVKGAFTGANEDQEGLIQKADGGILFLDEVHRLPPEGQEMIFYLMDHGTYSRLGETDKAHHANLRLICATTEDPESSLLATFVRRIPIVVQMPSFNSRTMRERFGLLKQMLLIEANRIHKKIYFDEDVARSLIGSVTYGNVGQLKSNVQLVCAQGFLNNIQEKDAIYLHFEQLPPNIKDGLSRLANDREQFGDLAKMMDPQMAVAPDDSTALINDEDNYELPYNLYEIIGDKAALLSKEGLDQEAINNFIMTDINVHLKGFYSDKHLERDQDDLYEIVDQDVVDLTNRLKQILKDAGYQISTNFLYAMSLHISSFIKRVESGKPLRKVAPNMISMVQDYPQEFEYAKLVKDEIENHYHLPVPDSELYYLAVLLISLQAEKQNGKVGVVVAAHGNSTASSMVQVVDQLLNPDNLTAFDMSLDMSPQEALKGIEEKVRQVDSGNGVILLVDMGSLSTFDEKISEHTGIKVKSVDMVTTALVLETARKTSLIDSDLENVYREISEFSGYSRTTEREKTGVQHLPKQTDVMTDQQPKAILAICSTGQGTAVKIKKMLDSILVDHLIDDIVVLPISVVDMEQQIAKIQKDYRIVAVTGIARPHLSVPFVSLEKLLQGGGEQFITAIENFTNNIEAENQLETSEEMAKERIQHYLGQYFTFLNPEKVTAVLWEYCKVVEKGPVKLKNSLKVNLSMHLAGVIERILTQSELTVQQDIQIEEVRGDPVYPMVVKANQMLAESLNITLPEEEVYYVVKLIDTQKQ
ncbi:sigma 54-interacting transcriptional regulator [Ligilactobacillus sp. 110_WCHN]|uniref:sigma 54-interacting transcriptional regulator n=1 Tax=Ligilactobacillus sp. 110_WCHN TaxID=3057125 RepID=UPI00267171D6|nr:sigma-54-dependent transcriptional regulator [Ligilactobacillus sp. 110_WCHN]MDO3393450.1 sigma 54-interacting transcriptional regulator [Ligilactobacillus sp. 110_WCHN]